MKVTKHTIKKIIKCIESSAYLHVRGIRTECEEAEVGIHEFIIRFEDLNGITHSLYFYGNDYSIGYFINDIYRWGGSRNLSSCNDTTSFIFDLALSLKAQIEYVENYVL